MKKTSIVALALGLLGLVAPLMLEIPGLTLAGNITLGIFLLAAVFWILEPIPIYATSMIVIFLQILLLSAQGPLVLLAQVPAATPEPVAAQVWQIPAEAVDQQNRVFLLKEENQITASKVEVVSRLDGQVQVRSEALSEETRLVARADHWMTGFRPPSYTVFLNTLANPIIILFLGGFVLAAAAVKYQLDRNITRIILKPFGNRPAYIAMGLMLVTATLSAFMSNTATTAMMMTVVIPIVAQLPPGDRFRIGVTLAIPFAANIGGIATPIGTPPNAVVIGALQARGITVPFTDWMQMAVPLVLVMLVVVWWLLMKMYPSTQKEVQVDLSGSFQRSGKAIVLYIVFALTVLLWVTEAVHGVSSSVVAFLPIAALPALRVIDKADIRGLSWEVLWLMAGGISLGVSMRDTGLAAWLISLISWNAMGTLGILAVFGLVALALSNFISNTVAATLLIPLAVSLGATGVLGDSFTLEITAVMIAVGCSLGMALPISTPPNAIAMSTGLLTTADMAKAGILIGIVGLGIAILLSRILWPFVV
jgi:solute carrier family 13 (sodium-dependent dicarboxylate transporter), member 2/3/5